jgi:adenylate cyclase
MKFKNIFSYFLLSFLLPIAITITLSHLGLLETINRKLVDGVMKVSKSHHDFSKDVVIIDIDEQSLSVYANHPEVGRWPWKRSIYPLLYSYIAMGNPELIINDILFTERSEEDNSLVLANQSFPFISHAASLQTEDNNFLASGFPFTSFSITNDSSHQFPEFQRGAFPNGDIGLSSQHIHIVNVIPDHDGILRRFAPILRLGDLGFPSLPVLGYFGNSSIQVQLEGDSIHLISETKSNSFTLNKDGFIRSYFYSPEILKSIPRYSASAVLESYSRIQDGLVQDESELLVSPEIFANKIVLIGTTASSTHDDIVTPFGLYPGVIVQSVFISNLREGHFLTEIPEYYGFLFAILLIGTISILVYSINQEWIRIAIPLILIISLSLLYYVFYQMDLILPISQSLVSLSFSILFGYAYLTYRDGLDKRKYSKVLRNLVDSSIVNLAIQDIDSLKKGGEWKITAFFSDIAGFSSISEELTASSLAELLNEYLSAMTLVLKKHSGTLDKYIGDNKKQMEV